MTRRPAETGAVAGAFALLIARLSGISDVDTVTAIAVALGFVPGAISWLVDLRRRRPPSPPAVTSSPAPPSVLPPRSP